LLRSCVLRADDPDLFAAHVVELLASADRRVALGEAALDRVRRSFSPEVCYGEFLEAIVGAP
jgi:succinoglycan biosynthesis protein ExoO